MDTLHFEPQSFHNPQDSRLLRDQEAHRIDDMNLSEVEVFMLRGRRLQAQAVGGALRRAFAKLRRLLRRSAGDAGSPRQPGRHRHA
jgi:hypothetical protein